MIITANKTLQEVSDEIAAKLIRQGHRCLDQAGYCSYDDCNGNRCAIGWLLENPQFFIGSMSDIIKSPQFKHEPNKEFILFHFDQLVVLQGLHDASSKDYARFSLDKAKEIGLDTTAWEPWIQLRLEQINHDKNKR